MINKTMTFIAGSLLFAGVFPGSAYGQQKERKFIREGNDHYENGRFEEAEVLYRKALGAGKGMHKSKFNLGDALYKQGKYDQAGKQFSGLTGHQQDKKDIARVYHNLGNALLKENRIDESIEAYKNALRNNPGDMETKYNLAYAMHLGKKKQQQQQQQQKQQDQNEQKREQDKQEKQNQQQNQQPRQQKPSGEQKMNEISREDARRMLEALQQEEKKLQEEIEKRKARKQRIHVEKEW